MKRMLKTLLLACLIALMVFTACADGKDKTEINVNGSGEVLVAADTAVITLGITTRNKDVLKAQNTVNATIEKIRAALIENEIKKEDINTDRLSIYAIYDYSNNVERLTAYNASSYLAIRTTDMDMVGKIIDIAFGAGANTLNLRVRYRGGFHGSADRRREGRPQEGGDHGRRGRAEDHRH